MTRDAFSHLAFNFQHLACICGLKHGLQLALQQRSLELDALIKGLQLCVMAGVSSSTWLRPTSSECRHLWLE